MSRVYLDDAGSAPILPAVRAALIGLPEGNPSSPHEEGRAARAALDQARDVAARALLAARTEVTFTSSGTEAVNLALLGAARRLGRTGTVMTWAAEHQSVLNAARHLQVEGHPVEILPVDGGARADPEAIPAGTALVSIGLANNEVGTVQPVTEIIRRARALGALVHVDACCGARWMPIPEGADMVSISGHKLGAGRGGILFVRDGVRLEPAQYGGPQEWGRRAGYEDVAAATAVAVALADAGRRRAAEAAMAGPRAASLREVLLEHGGTITGAVDRLPNFASCSFAGRRGEDLVMALDLAGVAVSSGSACASGSLDPSHVLLAAGFDLDHAMGSLRLTTGYDTTDEEVSRACAIIAAVLTRTRARA